MVADDENFEPLVGLAESGRDGSLCDEWPSVVCSDTDRDKWLILINRSPTDIVPGAGLTEETAFIVGYGAAANSFKKVLPRSAPQVRKSVV
jgi:hypothetical protein